MKCIKNTKGEITKVQDDVAHKLVKSGDYSYAKKSEFKAAHPEFKNKSPTNNDNTPALKSKSAKKKEKKAKKEQKEVDANPIKA